MKKILLIIFSILCVVSSRSQVTVSGKVTDAGGNPLPSISISLKKKNGIVLSFAITNAQGQYKINSAKAQVKDTLVVEANAIGFVKEQKPVEKEIQETHFKLQPGSAKLPDVKVQNNRVMLKKEGDTLNYDVASFSNKQDRTIGDVIKKLPGVEVADNGEITVGGKPINRFYIDGDNLLDGKYNIAARSIPNDAVAKIQVLENHQPVNVLKDVSRSESAAMNLVLKDKARLRLMGTGDAGAGPPDLYNVSANAMLFQKQVKFINNTKLNNTGNDLSDEVINHFGYDNAPPPSLLSAGAGGVPPLMKRRYLFNNTGLINANDLINLKNQFQLRVNASYVFDRRFQNSSYRSIYYLPKDTISYYEDQEARNAQQVFSTQFTLTANRKDYYLNNVTNIENTPSDLTAGLAAAGNPNIYQQLSGTITNLYNKFNIIKKSARGTVYEASSFVNLVRNPSTLAVMPGLYPVQFNGGNLFAALIQYAAIPTFYTDHYISIGKSTPLFQQQYKLGFSVQDQHIRTELDAKQISGATAAVADSFINRLNWIRTRTYFQPDLTYTSGKTMLRFTLPFALLHTRYTGRLADVSENALLFTPRVYFRYMTGRENYLTLNYNYNNDKATVAQTYDAYVMRNYRDFYANGSLMSETMRHSVAWMYMIRNTLKIFFFSVGGGYSTNRGNTISDTRVSAVIQQAKLIPFDNVFDNTQLYASVSKYIFPLSTTMGARASWSRSNGVNLLNGQKLKSQNNNYSLALNFTTKFSKWLNAMYTGTITTSNSSQTNADHSFSQSTPGILRWQHEASANINFSENVYTRIGMEQYRYRIAGGQDVDYGFVDVSLTWKLPRLKTDLELSLTNLAGVDTYSTANISASGITESSYRIRPRMAMLKFYFRF